jgi:hypothetical protein
MAGTEKVCRKKIPAKIANALGLKILGETGPKARNRENAPSDVFVDVQENEG